MSDYRFELATSYPAIIDPFKVAAAHERWYAKQPLTHCRRCDRSFPNVDNGKTEYCSYECQVGWFQAKPAGEKRHHKKHKRGRRQTWSSYRSKWS